ncbi:hypothetical protein I601_0368 [Nocardioides dokdonensis FR1436]|uniref:Uncharacterized protein n=2 Tax=Nocardioides TaxID=1839 RepID=A0A1A9GGL4_9ACTN|nr:hypothetical protein I601_0368 [Nocardioides dokdonensis FR1436]
MPFRGRAKWGPVAFDLLLAALGALLAGGVLVELAGENAAMAALAAYTVYAVVLTAALAVGRAVTRQLPTVRQRRLDGREGWLLRSWRGEWWHANALDAGIVVLAGWLVALGLRAGDDWLVPSLLVAGVGAWFLVRIALVLAGRRGNETLRLSGEWVVHESTWGTASCSRSSIVRVRALSGTRVLLVLDPPAELRPCLRPWRRARRRPAPDEIVVDVAMTGHDAQGVAEWIDPVLR